MVAKSEEPEWKEEQRQEEDVTACHGEDHQGDRGAYGKGAQHVSLRMRCRRPVWDGDASVPHGNLALGVAAKSLVGVTSPRQVVG
jgi:hypothetical protein